MTLKAITVKPSEFSRGWFLYADDGSYLDRGYYITRWGARRAAKRLLRQDRREAFVVYAKDGAE